jgi:myo-inositol 2-dehydrogenase / D-chiro-inositol 1-dehydrogenase
MNLMPNGLAKSIKMGLVGAGRIGRVHAQTLRQRVPEADLVVIADANQAAAQECAALYGIPHVAPNYEAILADDSIQAVIICTSTDTHAEFIIKAAQAGKHIFCEKPVDLDLARIDAVITAVETANVKLMIGFNRRFDSTFMRIQQAIAQGEIGTPQLLHLISRDPAAPPLEYIKRSGGMFFDMTIHDFDMARFLFGEVKEIYAQAAVMTDPAIGQAGDIDTALLSLKFVNGALGVIDNCRKAVYGYDQRVEAFGSLGAARSENLYPDAVTFSTSRSIHRGLPLNFFMDRYLDAYQRELAVFAQTVAQDKPSPVDGHDGRAPVVMALAAMRSLRENRPVLLTEIS